MKHKLRLFTLISLLFISALCCNVSSDNYTFAEESSVTESGESSSGNDSANTAEILIILGVFTVTAAVSSLVTYKILRKNKNNKSDS